MWRGKKVIGERRSKDLHRGDRLELATPRGPTLLRVAGVFQDYARSTGYIMIQRRNFEKCGDAARKISREAGAVRYLAIRVSLLHRYHVLRRLPRHLGSVPCRVKGERVVHVSGIRISAE